MNIFSLPKTEEAAIKFLQSKNILPTNKICENGHEMKLSIGTEISWRCGESTCRSEVNIRVGNWLEGSHIPIVTIVRFIYAWAIGMTAVNNKFCERELEMDSKTRTDWNNNLSSICVEHVVNKQKNLGIKY